MIRRIMAALVCLAPIAAQAEPSCGPREAVIDALAHRYGESRRAIGLTAEARVVEVFASVETGTWTIVVTLPDGRTCLVASGEAYEEMDEVLPTGEAL